FEFADDRAFWRYHCMTQQVVTRDAMMQKTIALVGHCGPDSSYLRMAAMSAERGVAVVAAEDDESLKRILDSGVRLLLVNRVLDFGFSETDGVSLIRRL